MSDYRLRTASVATPTTTQQTRAWLLTAAVDLVLLLFLARLLLYRWVAAAVGRWAILAGLAIFYELRIFKQTLPHMHPSELKPRAMTAGMMLPLTLLAGLCYALLVGFLLIAPPLSGWVRYIPTALALTGVIFATISYTISTKSTIFSAGNERLAREFQALGTFVITALAVHYGKLPPWFLLIGMMDYLWLFTHSWLMRKKAIPHPAPTSRWLPHFRILFLISSSLALFPAVKRDVTLPQGFLYGLPYFFLALRDWFILTGLLDPDRSQYRQVAAATKRALSGWLALSIRLLAAMAVATVGADMIFHFDFYASTFNSALYAGGVALMLLVALPFLFVGVRARIFGIITFVALALILLVMGYSTVILVGMFLTGLVVILGPGNLASNS